MNELQPLKNKLPNLSKSMLNVPIRSLNSLRILPTPPSRCFRADAYTLFKIADIRGSRVLIDVLGEDFAGAIGCDY